MIIIDKHIISSRIKEAMRENNISQRDLIKKTDIPKSSISDYLAGKYAPKRENIIKLAVALMVNPDWLEGQDVPKCNELDYLYKKVKNNLTEKEKNFIQNIFQDVLKRVELEKK